LSGARLHRELPNRIFKFYNISTGMYSLSFLLITKLQVTYVAVAFLYAALFWAVTWLIPVYVWFQKPINRSSVCPRCGSKDFRRSYIFGVVDRIRVFFGIHPFRCRGCTHRFLGRDEAVEKGREQPDSPNSESFKW
jgi:hypothetical protein